MTHYTTHKLTPELFEQWKKDRKGELIHEESGVVLDYAFVRWRTYPHNFEFRNYSGEYTMKEIERLFTLRLPVETKEQYAAVWFSDAEVDGREYITKWRDALTGFRQDYDGYFTRTVDSEGKVIGDPIWTVNKEEK